MNSFEHAGSRDHWYFERLLEEMVFFVYRSNSSVGHQEIDNVHHSSISFFSAFCHSFVFNVVGS